MSATELSRPRAPGNFADSSLQAGGKCDSVWINVEEHAFRHAAKMFRRDIFGYLFGSFSALRAEKEPKININLGNVASSCRAPEGALFYGSSAVVGNRHFSAACKPEQTLGDTSTQA